MENNNLLHKDMFSPGVHVVWGETYSDVYDRYRALVDSREGRSYWFHFDYDALEVKLFAFIPTNLNKTIGQLFCAAAQTQFYTKEQVKQLMKEAKYANFWDVKLKDLNWQFKEPLQILLAAFDERKTTAALANGSSDGYLAALRFLATRPYFKPEGAHAVWFVYGAREEIDKQINIRLEGIDYTLWACYSPDGPPVLEKGGKHGTAPAPGEGEDDGLRVRIQDVPDWDEPAPFTQEDDPAPTYTPPAPEPAAPRGTLEVVSRRDDIWREYIEVKLLEGRVNSHDVFVDEENGYRYISETYLLVYTPEVDEDGEEYEKETMYEDVDSRICDHFCFEIEGEDGEYYPFPTPGTILKVYKP